ncbi:WD40/YVTN/BNR-like repeat-containing protein [Actinomyces faecalis]|uniref:WD40/YVTN/BNR-like repeat-containing protein n=1 Tax=Actinomyces faecalis TaxID=2722820 RepID=UPI0015577D46|nr:hypothetical protein [Actinomyces faecalis]
MRPLLLVCLVLLTLLFIAAAVLTAFWLRYEEPSIPGQVIPALSATESDSGQAGPGVGRSGEGAGTGTQAAQGEAALDEASVVPAVGRWFGQWVEQHHSLTVSPSFQLSGGSATQIQWLGPADERIQETSGIRAWVQVDVALHPRLPAIEHFTSSALTGESTAFYRDGSQVRGQLVLELAPADGGYRVLTVSTPVQYQIHTDPSLREEPSPAEVLPDASVPATYRIREGELAVTYDSGSTWTTVPDADDGVIATANGSPRTSLDRGGYVVSPEFTGFLSYGPDRGQAQEVSLLYSLDSGASWQRSVIGQGDAQTSFVSYADGVVGVAFAVDRALGSSYYGAWRSQVDAGTPGAALTWEKVSVPDAVTNDMTLATWVSPNLGIFGNGRGSLAITQDGGASFMEADIPHATELVAGLGFDPFDTPIAAAMVDGVIEIMIGQGQDADHSEDGRIQEAVFSYDPATGSFSFLRQQAAPQPVEVG